jgi:tRNA G26 N,N-dimethylase Trm1
VEETDGALPYPVPTLPRVTGVLTAVAEELPDVPFFYHLPELASAVKSKVCTLGGGGSFMR